MMNLIKDEDMIPHNSNKALIDGFKSMALPGLREQFADPDKYMIKPPETLEELQVMFDKWVELKMERIMQNKLGNTRTSHNYRRSNENN
jgi:hypothetical protein